MNTAIPKTDLVQLCQDRYTYTEYLNRLQYIEQRKAMLQIEKKQRHNAIVSLCVGITVGILLCGFLALENVNAFQSQPMNQSYTMTGVLQGNCVVLEDGNVHEVEETNYTSEGIRVHCLMDDNGTTDDKTDDKVINTY